MTYRKIKATEAERLPTRWRDSVSVELLAGVSDGARDCTVRAVRGHTVHVLRPAGSVLITVVAESVRSREQSPSVPDGLAIWHVARDRDVLGAAESVLASGERLELVSTVIRNPAGRSVRRDTYRAREA